MPETSSAPAWLGMKTVRLRTEATMSDLSMKWMGDFF
jgi:hypothetical protein